MPTDETSEVEVEIQEPKPAPAPTFGDPRSFMLDDDWDDD
jgi:hypothetical protein